MLGFLFKIVLVAAIVAGVMGYIMMKNGNLSLGNIKLDPNKILAQLPIDKSALSNFRSTNPGDIGSRLSSTLDSLVTHPGRNPGPVVLGVQISNDTIGTITDVLMGLPPDQLKQITSVVCAPAATSKP